MDICYNTDKNKYYIKNSNIVHTHHDSTNQMPFIQKHANYELNKILLKDIKIV